MAESSGQQREAGAGYLPALRFRSLTAVYDPLIRRTTRESTHKRALLEQARLAPGQRVLDLGCGTGTLAVMAKRAHPAIDVIGLDGDPEILQLAESKARAAGMAARFDHGLSTALPYPDGSMDRVLSTLFFHHLSGEDKRRTIGEIARVLRPGGELHVADWGRPQDPAMWALSQSVRLFDGFERTSANLGGVLPELFEAGGLAGPRETKRYRTLFGTLALYSAAAPGERRVPIAAGSDS